MAKRRTVVFGFPGAVRDVGFDKRRWERWRPTVSLGQQDDFEPDLVILFHTEADQRLLSVITHDLKQVSPKTELELRPITMKDPWDFAEVAIPALRLSTTSRQKVCSSKRSASRVSRCPRPASCRIR